MTKQSKVIFSADDFGKCMEMDVAILKAFQKGVLTSTCIMPNGANFEVAYKEILPQCEGMGLGCHLNVIEGKSSLEKSSGSLLCDSSGIFNKGFGYMIANSTNKRFLAEVEAEFRSQIEAVLEVCEIDHLNSHVHVHGIPSIFDLTCRLAVEYRIGAVRTQAEVPYFASDKRKYSQMGMVNVSLNYAKNILLNLFTKKNRETAKKYGLMTNDCFVGLLFTSYMDKGVILDGLKAVEDNCKSGVVCEVLVHPYYYNPEQEKDSRKFAEYLLTQDDEIVKKICELGFGFTKFP